MTSYKKLVLLITAVLLAAAAPAEHVSAADWDWEHDMWVEHLADKYSVCSDLVKSIIKVESDFRYAVSPQGAIGFMQLMPETARLLGVKDINDPVENLNAGVKYFSLLLKRFDNNVPMALAAYNAGPTAVARHGGIPPYRETKDYVFKVLKYYRLYKKNSETDNKASRLTFNIISDN